MNRLVLQPPTTSIDHQRLRPAVLVKDFIHLIDRIKVPDDVSRAESLPNLYRSAMNLFDHDDDPPRPLTAPRFVHDIRIESQPPQPRPLLALYPEDDTPE